MRYAVVGDIHGFWDQYDTRFFNTSEYDGLLFVGDFARMTNSLPVARQLAQITKQAWAIPGNHDAVSKIQLLAEMKHWRRMRRLTCLGMGRRVKRLTHALGPVRLRGYTVEQLTPDLGLLIARPHAMGPDYFYYQDYLRRHFGVTDFETSAQRLKALVGNAPKHLVVLAHNGPAGLGDTADAPFGSDFNEQYGDFGDPDLRAAIDHAHETGHHVLAVVAGHMHQRNRHSGSVRKIWAHDGQTLYINTARVPRIRRNNNRHHVALTIEGTTVTAETIFVDTDGRIVDRELIGPDAPVP